MIEYIIYAQGPEHAFMAPLNTKEGKRVTSDRFATKYPESIVSRVLKDFRARKPTWRFEARTS